MCFYIKSVSLCEQWSLNMLISNFLSIISKVNVIIDRWRLLRDSINWLILIEGGAKELGCH